MNTLTQRREAAELTRSIIARSWRLTNLIDGTHARQSREVLVAKDELRKDLGRLDEIRTNA